MQNSCARKYENRKKTKERSLKRRKAKSSDVWPSKKDPLDLENPESQLTKTNIKNILTEQIFRTLLPGYQSKLAELLPECDRMIGPDACLSAGPEALNNEFFAKACSEWKERLADGDFTQETQIRCKLEREKRLHVDPWKKKYFESFWGEKLITSTTASVTSSPPILKITVLPSAQEKHQVLADLLTKMKPSNSTVRVKESSQQVRKQLSQMLNNKSMKRPSIMSEVVDTMTATMVTTMSPNGSCLLTENSMFSKQLSEDIGSDQFQALHAEYDTSNIQPAKKELRLTLGVAPLGKRVMNSEENCNQCPLKRPLVESPDIPPRSLGECNSIKSRNIVKNDSAACLMPVLANALLTNDFKRTASFSSRIPSVVLMEKPIVTGQVSESSECKTVTLSNLLRSDSQNLFARKRANTTTSVTYGSAAKQHEELLNMLKMQSSGNSMKKKLFDSESLTLENLDKRTENIKGAISEVTNVVQAKSGFGPQLILQSSSRPSSGLTTSFLNSFITSSTPLLAASVQANIGSFVLAPSVMQKQTVPSGSWNAFQNVSLSTETVTAASNNANQGFLSPVEPLYILQQVSSSPTVAKPLTPAVAFPHQTPVILVLGSSVVQNVALASNQVTQVPLTSGMPKLAINNQPLELAFTPQGGTGAQALITPASQTVIHSGTVLVANRPVVNSQTLQTLPFADQVIQKFGVSNQISKASVDFGLSPVIVSPCSQTLSNCGSPAIGSYFVNQGLQKLTCVTTASISETPGLNWRTSAGFGFTTSPLLIANQQSRRLPSANDLTSSSSQMLSFVNQTQNIVTTHPKNTVKMSPTLLTTYRPSGPSVVSSQLPQLVMAISGSTSQVLCGGKNSVSTIPIISPLAKASTLMTMSNTAAKASSNAVVVMRQVTPSPTEKPYTSYASPGCCNILPSPSKVQLASAPVFVIQTPLVKTTTAQSNNSLVTSSSRLAFASLSTAACNSGMITAPSQQPFVFQAIPENIRTSEAQKLVLSALPVNGTIEIKTKPEGGRLCSLDQVLNCITSTCSASACSVSCESRALSNNAHVLNGNRVKTITIKKLSSMGGLSSNHPASSTMQVPVQTRSLIKTLLAVHDPREQVLLLAPGSHDAVASTLFINRNTACTDSAASVQLDAGTKEVCRRCGEVLGQEGVGALNSLGICFACQSLV